MVHTKLLAYQWYEGLKELIPDVPIGFIGDGKLQPREITVAIYKSLVNNLESLKNNFEVILVDEAHLCPADMFSRVVNGLACRTKIALSATPTSITESSNLLFILFNISILSLIIKMHLS